MCTSRRQETYSGGGDGDGDGDGDGGYAVDDPFAQTISETVTAAAATKVFSALSPVQIVARGDVKIGYFNVSQFIKSVGPFAKVTPVGYGRSNRHSTLDMDADDQ